MIIMALVLAVYSFAGTNLLGELSGRQAWILLLGCLSDSAGMISMCIALQVENTSIVSMVGYLAIVYAIVTDVCFFGETLTFLQILGCAFILVITIVLGIARSK